MGSVQFPSIAQASRADATSDRAASEAPPRSGPNGRTSGAEPVLIGTRQQLSTGAADSFNVREQHASDHAEHDGHNQQHQQFNADR